MMRQKPSLLCWFGDRPLNDMMKDYRHIIFGSTSLKCKHHALKCFSYNSRLVKKRILRFNKAVTVLEIRAMLWKTHRVR